MHLLVSVFLCLTSFSPLFGSASDTSQHSYSDDRFDDEGYYLSDALYRLRNASGVDLDIWGEERNGKDCTRATKIAAAAFISTIAGSIWATETCVPEFYAWQNNTNTGQVAYSPTNLTYSGTPQCIAGCAYMGLSFTVFCGTIAYYCLLPPIFNKAKRYGDMDAAALRKKLKNQLRTGDRPLNAKEIISMTPYLFRKDYKEISIHQVLLLKEHDDAEFTRMKDSRLFDRGVERLYNIFVKINDRRDDIKQAARDKDENNFIDADKLCKILNITMNEIKLIKESETFVLLLKKRIKWSYDLFSKHDDYYERNPPNKEEKYKPILPSKEYLKLRIERRQEFEKRAHEANPKHNSDEIRTGESSSSNSELERVEGEGL